MVLLSPFAPCSASFNWEEIAGNDEFRVEQRTVPQTTVFAGVRRDMARISPFRIRLREFPKSIVAMANSQEEILEDWARIQQVLHNHPDLDCQDSKTLTSALHSVGPSQTPPAESLSTASAPPQGVRSISPTGRDSSFEEESANVRIHSAPPRETGTSPTTPPQRSKVPRVQPSGPNNGAFILGAHLCSLRTFFVTCCETLRANDPVSMSLIAFLFLLLYSMGLLSMIFLSCIPLAQAYILTHADQHAQSSQICIAVANHWMGAVGRWFDRLARHPFPLLVTELALMQFTIAMIYSRPFVLLLALWCLLLFLYLYPDEWMSTSTTSPTGMPDNCFPSSASVNSADCDYDERYADQKDIIATEPNVQLTVPAEGHPASPGPPAEPMALPVNEDIPRGYLGHLTMLQLTTLQLFKKEVLDRIPDYYACFSLHGEDTERHLLKWLRMQQWDTQKALRAVITCADWRTEFQGIGVARLWGLGECEGKLASRLLMSTGRGFHRIPVLWLEAHLHRRSAYDRRKVEFAVIREIERAIQLMDTTVPGPKGETITVVVNLSKFGIVNVDAEAIKYFNNLLTEMYPETLHSFILLDAPRIFNALWASVQSSLPPATAAKVRSVSREDLIQWVPRSGWHPLFDK